jgi:hypothetical protein
MSATDIVNDQMEKMRCELATANQQIGVIMECIEIQDRILRSLRIISSATTTAADRTLNEHDYDMLVKTTNHMDAACKRA